MMYTFYIYYSEKGSNENVEKGNEEEGKENEGGDEGTLILVIVL